MLTFSGTAGQKVNLSMTNATFYWMAWSNVYVYIYNPDGSALASLDLNGQSTALIDTLTLASTGTYTVVLDPPDTRAGSVTFTLNEIPPDVTGTITPGGPSVTLSNTVGGQNIRATFDGTAGQQVNLNITGNTFPFIAYAGAYGSYVSFLKPDGTSMFDVPMNGSPSGSTGTLMLPVTGTYTVFYNAQGMDTGQMTFTLNTVP